MRIIRDLESINILHPYLSQLCVYVCNDINGTPSLVSAELLSHSGRSSATDEIREFGGRVLVPLGKSVVKVASTHYFKC